MQDIEVLSNLNLNHLVVLLAVMREGSVTEAARILGRSQSAISHALSRLREDLDDPLLVRSGLQLVATPRAEEITEQLEDNPDGRDPIKDYEVLCEELEKFNADLLDRPQVVALNKIDLPRVRERAEEVRAHFAKLGMECFEISAAGHLGLDELKEHLGQMVLGDRAEEPGDDGLEWWERDDGIPPKIEEGIEEE